MDQCTECTECTIINIKLVILQQTCYLLLSG